MGKRGKKPQPVADRFWPKVDKNGPVVRSELDACWLWTASPGSTGYGQLNIGRPVKAHRVSWELHYGPIPKGLWVLHRCDQPLCVNPAHLYIGTAKDNSRDMWERGRGVPRPHKSMCPRGHPYDVANTYLKKGRYFVCRQCTRELRRDYQREYQREYQRKLRSMRKRLA